MRPGTFCARAPAGSHAMAQQQNLFSPDPDSPEIRPDPPMPARPARVARPAPWLERTELLVRVIVRLYLGLLIVALPWLHFWTENGLLSYLPGAGLLTNSGFVRGVISGLGALNIAIAFQELFFPQRRD